MPNPVGLTLAAAAAEARSLRRSAGAWLIAILAAATGLAAYYVLAHLHATLSSYQTVVSPRFLVHVFSTVPFLVLLFGVAVLAGEARRRDALDQVAASVDARPPANLVLTAGRWLGLLASAATVLLATLLTIQAFGIAAHAFDWPVGVPLEPVSLVVFVVVDAVPALALWCALALLLATGSGRALGALVAFGLLAGTYWLLHNVPIHLLPAVSILPSFGVVASDMLPQWADGWLLAQRGCVLLLTGGLLVAAAAVHPRPDGCPSDRCRGLAAGAVLISVAAIGVVLLAFRSGSDLARRDEWLAAQRAVAEVPRADMERIVGRVRIEPGRDLTVNLDLTLSRPEVGLGEIVFSLNPGMRVERVAIDGESTGHRHESGLLFVQRRPSLDRGGTFVLSVAASGVPDPRFAYLDGGLDPMVESWRTSLLPYFGTVASIFDDDYVALTPGVRWLPMPGPNLEPDPAVRPPDFFTIDLEVEAPAGWRVAAPGRARATGEPNRHRFRPGAPLDEVTVVAAPFERYAMELAGVEAELLLHPAHVRNVELLAGFEETVTRRLAGYLARARAYGTPYPYDGVSVVEVPAPLRVYGGGRRMPSVLSSPGVFLMREHGFPTARFDRLLRFLYSRDVPASTKVSPVFLYFLRSRVGDNLLAGASDDLLLSVTAPRGEFAETATYVLARLASLMFGARQNVFSAYAFTETSLSDTATAPDVDAYHATRLGAVLAGSAARLFDAARWDWDHPSLWDRAVNAAWADIAQGDDPHHDLASMSLIADALTRALFDSLEVDGVGELLAELRHEHAGRTFTMEHLGGAAAKAGFPLGVIVDDWLRGRSLPAFAASRAVVRRLAGDEASRDRYHVKVMVRNEGAAWGLVAIEVGTDWDSPGQTTLRREWLDPVAVPRHSAVEIGIVRSEPPEELWLLSYLSRNRADMQLVLEQDSDDRASREEVPFVGVRPAVWRRPAEPGVVVDDLDPGFAVVSRRPRSLMQRLARRIAAPDAPIHLDQGIEAHPDAERGWTAAPESAFAHPRWRRQEFGSAWGRHRRTLARIRGGEGTELAVFTARLGVPGRWRLEYHVPDLSVGARSKVMAQYPTSFGRWTGGPLGTHHLTLAADGWETSVEFDAGRSDRGWHRVGTFNLDAGEVRVTVSSRSSADTVVADAIRWRRIVPPQSDPLDSPTEHQETEQESAQQ